MDVVCIQNVEHFLKNFINIEKVNIVLSHSTSFNEENEIIAVCNGQSSENNLHVLKMVALNSRSVMLPLTKI